MSRFDFWQPQRSGPIFRQPQGRGPIKTLVEIYDELQSRVPAISRDCRTFFSLERWMHWYDFSKLYRTSASEPRLSGRKSTVRVSTVWPTPQPRRLPSRSNTACPLKRPARNRHFCDLSHNRLSGARIVSNDAGLCFDKGRTSFMMYVDNARHVEALP
jgi:hypothetical protein